MEKILSLTIITASMALAGCQTTSKTAQTLFTPEHYDPPNLYKAAKSKTGDLMKDEMLVRNKSMIWLNANNSSIVKFQKLAPGLTNQDFSQIAYLYLTAAESQCEHRISDINRSRTANSSGFGMLTTASAVIGSALASSSGANAASGAAAIFSSLSSNANGFETQIASQYSGNITKGITKTQENLIHGQTKNGEKSDGISETLQGLLLALSKKDFAGQAKAYYLLQQYNRACTVSAGQRKIEEQISQ